MLCGPELAMARACTSCCLILQRLQRGAFLGEVGINQIAQTLFENVDKLLRKLGLNLDPLGR